MTKRYFDYTDKEKLKLSSDEYQESITLEAIWRGIKPPITLSSALLQSEYRGYQIPPEAVIVYELSIDGSYSAKNTGVAYLKREDAERAIAGAVSIEDEGYGATAKKKIKHAEYSIKETRISLRDPKNWNVRLEEFFQDNTEFEKVAAECCEDFSKVRQADYDSRVISEKRTEYLRLAKGNEDVAKSFWNKTERTDWPEIPVVADATDETSDEPL